MAVLERAEREIADFAAAGGARQLAARQQVLQSDDLFQFVAVLLPAAVAGDGLAQYQIYLALDACRTFLGLDPDTALRTNERMLGVESDLSPVERAQWEVEYQRCLGFAIEDWSFVSVALGPDQPGARNEVASVWFERSVQAGFPPALVEQALRHNLLNPAERRQRLEQAVASGNQEVFWVLFEFSYGEHPTRPSATAVAWLFVACRAGLDCRRDAAGFHTAACSPESDCPADRSALHAYWNALAPAARLRAYDEAGRIGRLLALRRYASLPFPAPVGPAVPHDPDQ